MAKAGRKTFAVGIDYGTNSVRTLIVDTADGSEIATSVYDYPSGDAGILLDPKDPNVARQNPADYIDGFVVSVREAVQKARGKRGGTPRPPPGPPSARGGGAGIPPGISPSAAASTPASGTGRRS